MALPADEDNFEEDGCTFDFFDETDDAAGSSNRRPGDVYREYEGEDFAPYLEDDDDEVYARRLQEQAMAAWMHQMALSEDGGGKRKTTVRERLGRILNSAGSGVRSRNSQLPQQPPPPENTSRIYDMSYADCKMGSVLQDPRNSGLREGATGSAPGSDSGIDVRSSSGISYETESDLGIQGSSSWWSLDTLSSRRARPSSDLGLGDGGARSVGDGGKWGGESIMSEPSNQGTGVVMRGRKNPSEQDRDSSKGSKRLSNSLLKIYNTISRRKPEKSGQMSYAENTEDIRL